MDDTAQKNALASHSSEVDDDMEEIVFHDRVRGGSAEWEKQKQRHNSIQVLKNVTKSPNKRDKHPSEEGPEDDAEEETLLWTRTGRPLMISKQSDIILPSNAKLRNGQSFEAVLTPRRKAKEHLLKEEKEGDLKTRVPQILEESAETSQKKWETSTSTALNGGNKSTELSDSAKLDFVRFVSSDDVWGVSSSAEHVSDERLVRTIIEEMVSERKELAPQMDGLQSLRNLSYDEQRRALIGTLGGVKVAINAMKDFPIREELQILALSFLTDACQLNMFNKLEAGNCEGIEVLISSLRTALDHSTAWVEACCVALCTFCQGCNLNQNRARGEGALEALLNTMRRKKCSVSLQEKCLRAMLAVIKKQPESQTVADEYGGVQEVLAVIQQFPGEECIQTVAMEVALEFVRESASIREEIANAGIIDHIQEVLPKMMHSKLYLLHCCGCIRYLAFIDARREEMGAGVIVAILAEALGIWKGDERVILAITMALSNLTYDMIRTKHDAAQNGIEILLELLTLHKSRKSITEQTCRLLRNISDGRISTKRICVREGVVPAVGAAMKAQPASPGVQEHASAVLLNLSQVHGADLGTMGINNHIENVLTLHAATPETKRQLLHLQNVISRLKPQPISFATMFRGVVPPAIRPNPTLSAQPSVFQGNNGAPLIRQYTITEEVLEDTAVASALAALTSSNDTMEY